MVVARKKNAVSPAPPAATPSKTVAARRRAPASVAPPVIAAPAALEVPGKKAVPVKRKRLAKAFSRPLDKKRKKSTLVRERFTFPEAEYARLVDIKKRLAASGISIKKSELLRAGLLLLDAVDDETLRAVLARVPPVA